MANQPTKYRKFVVGAASAALVASAVAPVAFAADFSDTKGNTHEEAINALSEAGVIKGYEDGTFKPNKTLTRSDVVKLMGKWLVSEGYKVPTDAQSKPRFADLKSTSNKELLEMAAVVYDNGVFVGTPDGKLDPTGDITRENMAIVLVRAFDRVHDIDLASYVADQDFKKDVTDLGKAKAEARPAIDVLDFFDITNPAAPEFNPKATTTRGHFATFLHKTINADFSDVEGGVVAPGVASVKAVNATTVEVAMKEKVDNINSLNFKIDGLTVSNAAVKQSDDKVVVLTTAVQKGGEKYTVTLNDKAIGSFTGVSAVVPTKIDMNTESVQGKVGQQAILSADVGVKEAGIPVTFNVKTKETSTLNKDQVFETVTNAEGIATFSYTQYAAGIDEVVAYPTGAPTVRDYATVHWGVDAILTLEEDDKKGTSLNNGENKVYKVTYKDPKTGKPVANKPLNVTFAENVDVAVNKLTDATINGKKAYQTTNGDVSAVTVTTDSKGEATFTVSGTNTKATPVVFVDNTGYGTNAVDKLDRTELQVKGAELTFAAVHAKYEMEVTRDGSEEAATGLNNGRTYKIAVKDENGKAAAGEVVNVAFDEVLDRVISTNTKAEFIIDNENLKGNTTANGSQQIRIQLDAKGEAEFQVATATDNNKDYATPVVWIDINTSNNKDGVLEQGEPTVKAGMTYFADEKVSGSALKVYEPGTPTEIKGDRTIDAAKGAEFKFSVANQSGKAITATKVKGGNATFKVENTDTNDVVVFKNKTDLDAYIADKSSENLKKGTVISTKRKETVTVNNISTNVNNTSIFVVAVDGKSAAVEVTAYGEFNDVDNKVVNLSESKVAKATFKSSATIIDSYNGVVESFDKDKQTIKFVGKDKVDYKEAATAGNVSYFKVLNGAKVGIGKEEFERALSTISTDDVTVNYFKSSEGKIEFTVIDSTTGTNNVTSTLTHVQGNAAVSNTAPADVALGTLTFTSSATAALNGYDIVAGTVADGTTASATLDTDNKTITINGDFSNDDASSTYTSVVDLQAEITGLTLPNSATITVGGTPGVIPAGAKSVKFTGGKDAAPATTEISTLEITNGARVTGDITVNVNGTPTTVAVVAGDSAATVASKISAALTTAGVTGYTVSVTDNKVVFTATTPGVMTDITVVITN